jgi:hypothetical protein
MAGVVFLAGASTATAGNAARTQTNSASSGLSGGIRDPMNPQAYMRDLAARMGQADQKVFLQGVNVPPPAPAPTGQRARRVWTRPSGASPGAVVPRVQDTSGREPVVQAMVGAAGTQSNPAATAQEPIVRGWSGTAAPQSAPTAPNPPAAASTVGTPAAPPVPVVSFSNEAGTGTAAQDAALGGAGTNAASDLWQSPPPAAQPTSESPDGMNNSLSTVPAGSPMPAPLAAPMPSTSLAGIPGRSSANRPMPRGPGAVQQALLSGTSGLTLWEEPKLASRMDSFASQPPEPKEPWTLAGDLEKYRAYAVKEGSRDSGESLKKALERAGMAVGDGANVFLLGYASERAKPFRENDGKGLFQEPGKVPERAGATIGSLGYALYSVLDLATVNGLPDPEKPAYTDNHPLVRPLIFTGRTIGGVWQTTEAVGNALTWGFFDNVTGCVGLVLEDILELLKHAGEAVTNVARVPFHLAAGKKDHEGTDRALDWVLLVPWELASNAVEMKGISNMVDYQTAFADKGVIGSVLEFGGSTYIVYRAVDEALDDLRDDKPKKSRVQNSESSEPQTPTTPETPTTPDVPVEEVPASTDAWLIFGSDGSLPNPSDPIFTDPWFWQ